MTAAKGVGRIQKRPPPPEADPFWRDRAACNGVAPELFFDPALARWGVEVCQDCPVRQPCRASREGAEGVWGGRAYYPRKPRRSRR